MLVPGAKQKTHINRTHLYAEKGFAERCRTSVGFDALDVFLGVCDLNGRAGDQLLAPAAHIVVEVDDAEVVVDGEVVQDGLHGLHRL